MTILEIFEKINLKIPVEQRTFFNYLNDSINEIAELYGEQKKTVFLKNLISEDIVPIRSFDDIIPVLPLYHNAIVDNIFFLYGQGENYKVDFLRKSREAYHYYWSESARNRKIKRAGW